MSEPWVRYEDEHLLVVHKPAGVNTHRADEHAQDGLYDWVQRQRPTLSLSILHRLDKATSGLLVFGKSVEANRSLSRQFEDRTIAKTYELLANRGANRGATQADELRCDEPIATDGRAHPATTDFRRAQRGASVERWEAHPHTGRTHQVRLHAAALGLPIIGDDEHGGPPGARLFLHAARLGLEHPTAGPLDLDSPRPATFDRVLDGADPQSPTIKAIAAREARDTLFDPADTDAYLWIDRHHDGFPDVRVERLGTIALVLNYTDAQDEIPAEWLDAWMDAAPIDAIYEQRRPRSGNAPAARRRRGHEHATSTVTELGCRYLIDLEASTTSSGLFLDQRETRRWLLGEDRANQTVLNVFAHTGSLSVAAAKAGAETLTLDLSTRYLDWARDNLRANDLDPADHDFIYGDALSWMDRLAKKGRRFDLVLVDPPSTSTTSSKGGKSGRGTRKSTRWVAERDLHALVAKAARLTNPGGTVFVSTNLRRMTWPRFLEHVDEGLAAAHREARHVETQTLPLDHRTGPGDPPYLKAAWLTLE